MTTIIDVNNIVKGIASTIGSPKVKGPNADPVKPIPAKITVTIVREISVSYTHLTLPTKA